MVVRCFVFAIPYETERESRYRIELLYKNKLSLSIVYRYAEMHHTLTRCRHTYAPRTRQIARPRRDTLRRIVPRRTRASVRPSAPSMLPQFREPSSDAIGHGRVRPASSLDAASRCCSAWSLRVAACGRRGGCQNGSLRRGRNGEKSLSSRATAAAHLFSWLSRRRTIRRRQVTQKAAHKEREQAMSSSAAAKCLASEASVCCKISKLMPPRARPPSTCEPAGSVVGRSGPDNPCEQLENALNCRLDHCSMSIECAASAETSM